MRKFTDKSVAETQNLFFDLPRFGVRPLGSQTYIECVISELLMQAPSSTKFHLHAMGLRGSRTHKERLKQIDQTGRAAHLFTFYSESLQNNFCDVSRMIFSNADIVHSFGSRIVGPMKSKLVVTIQDVIPLRLREGTDDYIAGVERTLKSLVRRADAIITISEYSKKEIVDMLSVPPDLIRVIQNGVDGSKHRPVREEERSLALDKLRGIGITTPYFVHFGGAAERKNVGRLIDAFAEFRRTTKGQQQLILCGQNLPEHLQAKIEKHGLKSSVLSMGYLDRETASIVMRLAEMLIFPSTYEGFGLPPLEAMSSGVPVAVSNATSLPEVCGDAAAYFNPYSVDDIAAVIERLAGDTALRQNLISLGLQRSREFTWAASTAKTMELYRSIT